MQIVFSVMREMRPNKQVTIENPACYETNNRKQDILPCNTISVI